MARGTICHACGRWHDPMLVRCPPVPLGPMEMHVAPEVYAVLAGINVTPSVTKISSVTKIGRGRPKQFASNAERQRAYRKRSKP